MSGNNATSPTPTIPGLPPAIASLIPPGTVLPPGVTITPDEPIAYLLQLLAILQHAQDYRMYMVPRFRHRAEYDIVDVVKLEHVLAGIYMYVLRTRCHQLD